MWSLACLVRFLDSVAQSDLLGREGHPLLAALQSPKFQIKSRTLNLNCAVGGTPRAVYAKPVPQPPELL